MHVITKAVPVAFCFSFGSVAASEAKLPPDVGTYVEQRDGCEHFRGEIPDPPDKRRMREVEREIRKLCTGTDKKLAQLKRKYAKNPTGMKRLEEYEENIE